MCNQERTSMEERISRDDLLMRVAHLMSQRSTCNRLHVGAVIAQEGRIVSTGYAGAPSGVHHCDDSNCTPSDPCNRTVHAEAGAISYAARKGISTEGATLYCTHQPCLKCSQLIINSGIKRVVYDHPYRDNSGLELLLSVGVTVNAKS